MPKIESKPQAIIRKLSEHLGLMVTIITSLAAIGGAGIAACNWVVDTVSAQSNQRIDQLQAEIEKSNDEHNLAIMRLELMNLIQNDPNNVVEIEKVGRKYFSSGGDWYASGYFSKWCTAHNCDASIVLEGKK